MAVEIERETEVENPVMAGALEQAGAALAQKKERGTTGGLSTGKLTYTREVMEEICCGLASGKSLREVCRGVGMPAEATVRYWVSKDIDGCALGAAIHCRRPKLRGSGAVVAKQDPTLPLFYLHA